MAKPDALAKLQEGYARFQAEVFPQYRKQFHLLAEMQKPDVLFITCADSRIVPQMVLQTEPGDLFICREVGNVVPRYGDVYAGSSSTVEYAVKVLHVRHIIICGHSDCGAVRAVFEDRDLRKLPITNEWLRFVEEAREYALPAAEQDDELARLKELICANVRKQVENLQTHPEVREAIETGHLKAHGWFYDIQTGTIEEIDQATGERHPLLASAGQGAPSPATASVAGER